MCNDCFKHPNRRSLLGGALSFLFLPNTAQAATLKILSRKDWGAASAKPGLVDHKPFAVLIHHSGVPSKPNKTLASKMKGLQAFSQREEKLATGKLKPAWPDVPYHFMIDPSGLIAEGRDPVKMGDTNTDYDPKGYLQIAVEGDFTKESPTDAQVASTIALAQQLVQSHGLQQDAIYFHNEKASTQCPGRNLTDALKRKLRAV